MDQLKVGAIHPVLRGVNWPSFNPPCRSFWKPKDKLYLARNPSSWNVCLNGLMPTDVSDPICIQLRCVISLRMVLLQFDHICVFAEMPNMRGLFFFWTLKSISVRLNQLVIIMNHICILSISLWRDLRCRFVRWLNLIYISNAVVRLENADRVPTYYGKASLSSIIKRVCCALVPALSLEVVHDAASSRTK